MARKSERLKSILNLAKNEESSAAKEMRLAMDWLEKLQKSLSDLSQYHNEYKASWQDSIGKNYSIDQLNQYRNFLAQIDNGIRQQKQQIEQAQHDFTEKKQLWLGRRARTKALSKVMENYHYKEKRQDQQREQKLQDEFAARRKPGSDVS